MKTVSGNTVRLPYSSAGIKVSSLNEANKAIGFSIRPLVMRHPETNKELPGRVGLFRDDNGGCLGIHTGQFSFLQPSESMEMLDRARKVMGGEWKSVVATKGGEQISAFIALENAIIVPNRGDRVALMFCAKDFFNGAGKRTGTLTGVNLTCCNGMTGMENLYSFADKHTAKHGNRADGIEYRLYQSILAEAEAMKAAITKLDATPMTSAEVVSFASRLFPVKDEADVPTRTANRREEVITGFTRGTGNRGETRWDAFNSVTEMLDWNGTFRKTEFSREENRFESLMSGAAATVRNRALALLLD